MRTLLTVLLCLLSAVVSLGQEEIYWPDHEGIRGARWSPDGNYIATWGESTVVRIWHDHDGSLALELDHSSVEFVFPNGKVREATDSFRILGVGWSDDMQFIISFVQPDILSHFFEVTWTSDRGEPLYDHYSGTWFGATKPREFHWKHQVIRENEIVASWYDNVMSFIDTNPASDSIGQELASIDFGGFSESGQRFWSADRTESLLLLYPKSAASCEDCTLVLRLYDTDLDSEAFGEYLWQTEAHRKTQIFAWPNIHDLLAATHDENVNIWNLDRDSADFGSRMLQIKLEGELLHDIIYAETMKRLVVPVVKEISITSDESVHHVQCRRNDCEFNIGVWEFDATTSSIGERLYVIRHLPYKWYVWMDGSSADINRLNLNSSESQIHVYSASRKDPDDVRQPIEEVLTAYDLGTGERVEASGIVPESRPVWNMYLPARPQLDFEFELKYTTEYPDVDVMAVNPTETKVIAKLTDLGGWQTFWFLVNIETGAYLFPSGEWKVPTPAG